MRYIIKAVPERQEFVDYLLKHLPQAEVCMDQGRDVFRTFLKAFEMAGQDACVHMEEDVILTQDFTKKVEAVIADRPHRVIQFFSMRKKDRDIGSRYDPARGFIANLCTYYPAGYSKLVREFYPVWELKNSEPNGTDFLVRDFLRSRREKYWIHCPSLVEHRVGVSVIDSRRSSKRQSKTFENPVK